MPRIDDAILEAIVDLLAAAWNEARATEDLSGADEDDHNQRIESKLLDLLERRAESDLVRRSGVQNVTREASDITFDGQRLSVQPDLKLHVTDPRRPFFPLIVECKIIDRGSPSLGKYRKNGIERFTSGQYAWSSREALMIGYVHDGSRCDVRLARTLAANAHRTAVERGHGRLQHERVDLYRSSHPRNFRYPLHPERIPGPILLWHLWLDAVPSDAHHLHVPGTSPAHASGRAACDNVGTRTP